LLRNDSSKLINILYTVCCSPLFDHIAVHHAHRLLVYTRTATSYCCHILRTKARERVTIFTRVTRSRENGSTRRFICRWPGVVLVKYELLNFGQRQADRDNAAEIRSMNFWISGPFCKDQSEKCSNLGFPFHILQIGLFFHGTNPKWMGRGGQPFKTRSKVDSRFV
jgi:hypothetical protein